MQHPDEPTQALPASEVEHPVEPDATTAVVATPKAAGPRPWVWIVSGLLVLALIAGIAWFVVSSSRQVRETAIREAATSFLTAVAEGNATAALDLLAEQPANTTLLTDAVLAASQQAAPITAVEVGALGGTEDAPTVDATYQVGDEAVSTTLTLSPDGRAWKVTDGTVDLTVPERRALTVNGVEVTEEVNPVFPGTYTAAAVSDKVALTGEPTATVTAPEQEGTRIEVTPGLSELGTQTVLETVKSRFDACLAETVSRPVNCPFGVDTTGVEVAEGTVKFNLASDPWAEFVPTLDPDTLVASGRFSYLINATATVTKDGLTTEATAPLSTERGYAVDLTKDPATVTWS